MQQPYEPLDNTTQVVRPKQPNSYEEMNNDVWSDIFPVKNQPIAAVQLQPISDISYQKETTQIHEPLSSELTLDDYGLHSLTNDDYNILTNDYNK